MDEELKEAVENIRKELSALVNELEKNREELAKGRIERREANALRMKTSILLMGDRLSLDQFQKDKDLVTEVEYFRKFGGAK